MKYIDKLKTILKHYGAAHQIKKCREELGELSYELDQKPINRARVVDETADVINMLIQMADTLSITQEEINERCRYKIDRQLKRIEEETKWN